jgi:hypothetical protein
MTIDAAHRASIYGKLRPILGNEDANVLMSQDHSVEGDVLVTRDHLRAELALTTSELRGELAEIRAEMGALETRLSVRLGSAIAASTATLLAAMAVLS